MPGIVVTIAGMLLAACSSAPPVAEKTKEYFSQAVYGKASPRKVASGKPVPKGGGRYHVGKPYRIAGKTYVPRDNPNYTATGLASWYGAAFHGRQTANGEVYDMNALTAAHPTLPLPSYVRVTNLENGRSVVVRVNDRGPFAHNRIIDVSKATAQVLDFQKKGTVKVRVDYVRQAGLEGSSDRALLATLTGPGIRSNGGALPKVGLRGHIQLAAAPAPRIRNGHVFDATLKPMAAGSPLSIVPAYAPADTQPDLIKPLIMSAGFAHSFAPAKPASAAHAAAASLAGGSVEQAVAARVTVQVGTFGNADNARRAADALGAYGKVDLATSSRSDGRRLQIVRVTVADAAKAQRVIDAAAAHGLRGAFVVSR